jgi:hypothetical protein
LVKQRKRILKRIEDKAASALKDGALLFEELGIDAVMVDEAHIFKKISLATRKQLKGLNKEESGRGWILSALTSYVKRQNNGKGVFMFTGTPLTNNLNEAYNMMQYVMDDVMGHAGVKSFDDWFNSFAASTTDVELTSGGTMQPVTRLLSFVNVPELARMASRYFDVVLAKHMPEFKERTSEDGMDEKAVGRPHKKMKAVTAEMSEAQREYKASIEKRYNDYQKLDPKTKRLRGLTGGDTPILMETDGANSALDQRLVDPDAPDHPGSKLNLLVHAALGHYAEHPKATQAIFMERGMNDFVDRESVIRGADGYALKDDDGNSLKSKTRVRSYNLVRDIVEKLVKGGVDPGEIAVLSNMNLDPEDQRPNDVLRRVVRESARLPKNEIAKQMREGKIRFAIGSTQTLGTGVNAQTYMRAMHHLDAPWTPGEFEQRNGRGWRQGNKWNTVHEYRYFTEGSHDGRRWQVLLNKVRFIQRFTDMLLDSSTGKGIRVLAGDGADLSEDGAVADFAGSFSSAVGDPRIQLRAKLENDVKKLEQKRSTFFRAIQDAKQKISGMAQEIEDWQGTEQAARKAVDTYRKDRESPFSITIDGKTITDRKAAEKAIAGAPSFGVPNKVEIGHIGSFAITYDGRYKWTEYERRFGLKLGDMEWNLGNFSLASMEAVLRQLPQRLERAKEEQTRLAKEREGLKEMLDQPFGREEELTRKKQALEQIKSEMSRSPLPAPAWLRNGVPVGSLVYLKDGKAYDVVAHRRDANGYWVLVDENNTMKPVNYLDVRDEAGTRIFDPVDGDKLPEEEPGGRTAREAMIRRRKAMAARRYSALSAPEPPKNQRVAIADPTNPPIGNGARAGAGRKKRSQGRPHGMGWENLLLAEGRLPRRTLRPRGREVQRGPLPRERLHRRKRAMVGRIRLRHRPRMVRTRTPQTNTAKNTTPRWQSVDSPPPSRSKTITPRLPRRRSRRIISRPLTGTCQKWRRRCSPCG